MAGSIEENAALYKKKAFTYVPPSSPADLIESTSYTLDFAARKFIQVGILSDENYQVVLNILTSSRYVQITTDFLKKIFSCMGHILSFILDTPQKYNRVIFFEDEIMKLSSMVYTGENVLVIEDKTQIGCRVLLNREDLIRLQYLERSIIESIIRKEVYTVPLIHYQSEEFVTYLREKCTQMESSAKNLDEMTTFIKNVQDDRDIKSFPNLSAQIQMCSTKQLAESVLNKNVEMNSPTSPRYSPVTNIFSIHDEPLTYASLRQLNPLDHIDDPQTPDHIDNPQIPDDISNQQSVDVNDGPDFFNLFYSPSTYTQHPALSHIRSSSLSPSSQATHIEHAAPFRKRSHPTFAEHPTSVRNVKPRLF